MIKKFVQYKEEPKEKNTLNNEPQIPGAGAGNAQRSGANEQKQAAQKGIEVDPNAGRTGFETSDSIGNFGRVFAEKKKGDDTAAKAPAEEGK
jgi:hypothetical protein